MTIWMLALVLAMILAGGVGFLWIALHMPQHKKLHQNGDVEHAAERDVEHIFNTEFREELRNRGRLHFEKILGENAMFLQQDLRLTTAQLNDYMKNEVSKGLKEAFSNYENALSDAKQLAVESIEKTKTAIDEQRALLGQQLDQEIAQEKQRRMQRFETNMADIINHYVLAALGNQIDLNDQLEYILGELEANKQAIIEDVTNGA